MAMSLTRLLLVRQQSALQNTSLCAGAQSVRWRVRKRKFWQEKDAKDNSWMEPLLEYRQERETSADQDREPAMLHVVRRTQGLKGRPWWEKKLMERLGLDGKFYRRELTSTVMGMNYVSVFCDGATDVSIKEQELMFMRSVHKGIITVRFLAIAHTPQPTAQSIYDEVVQALRDAGMPDEARKHKLVRFAADGAAVMQRNEVVIHKNTPRNNSLLKEIKHLVSIQPLVLPDGMPDDPRDFADTFMTSRGELRVKHTLRPLSGLGEVQDEEPQLHEDKWALTLDTINKKLRYQLDNYEVHEEYIDTYYNYTMNQDGKEYRYNGRFNTKADDKKE